MRISPLLAVLVAACSSAPGNGQPAADAGATDLSAAPTPPTGDGGEGGKPASCSAQSMCRGTNKSGWQCVKTLDTQLLDEAGAPIANVSPSVCGKNLCLFGKSNAQGQVHIPVCYWLDSPAFKLLGGHNYVSFAAPLASEVISLPATTLTRLPAVGAPFPSPGQAADVTSGPVTLTITSATKVTFDSLQGDDMQLRAAPLAAAPPGVDGALGLELFFGLAPIETVFDPPVGLTVPNVKGWAASSAVELFILGLSPSAAYAPYAGWKSVGSGHVSDDGQRITTDVGVGIPQLSVVGIRRQ
jgi:hypothetical protein